MALNNHVIAQKVFEALRDSAALADKCDDLFSQWPVIYLGISGEGGPPPEDCPVLEVTSWNKEQGDAPDSWPFNLSVNIFLRDETRQYATTAKGVKTVVNRGSQSLEEVMDLAAAAIRAALVELDLDDFSFDYDEVSFFPLFAGALNLTVSFPKLGGGGFTPTL